MPPDNTSELPPLDTPQVAPPILTSQPLQPLQPLQAPVPVKEPTNAGLLILQWLTYAFWGWTVLALSVLTGTVIASLIAGSETGGFMPYGIAAVLVLLPISYACDYFYSKKEPQKKTGPEVIVMVIHAVIFAIFGIGSLIFAMISLVQLFTSSGESSTTQANLYTSLIVTVYYGITFLRTLNPEKIPGIRRFYRNIMAVSISIIVLLGIIGPISQERSTRDDRLIAAELSTISNSINDYARANNKLPSDLNALDLQDNAKQLVDKDLVTYKPRASSISTINFGANSILTETLPVYRYELCVNYKKKTTNYSKYKRYNSYYDDGYASYISAYEHPAGNVCYKLKTDS